MAIPRTKPTSAAIASIPASNSRKNSADGRLSSVPRSASKNSGDGFFLSSMEIASGTMKTSVLIEATIGKSPVSWLKPRPSCRMKNAAPASSARKIHCGPVRSLVNGPSLVSGPAGACLKKTAAETESSVSTKSAMTMGRSRNEMP